VKLLDEVRQAIRVRHYSYDTEQSYVRWVEQFVRFTKGPDGWRHPKDLGVPEVEAFLTTWPSNATSGRGVNMRESDSCGGRLCSRTSN